MNSFLLFLGATSSLLFSGCDFKDNAKSRSISVKSTEAKFSLEATFDPDQLPKLMEYLEKSLGEPRLFNGPSDFKNTSVNLGDTLKFNLKVSAGSLTAEFWKHENSLNAYRKLEHTCRGLDRVLSDE